MALFKNWHHRLENRERQFATRQSPLLGPGGNGRKGGPGRVKTIPRAIWAQDCFKQYSAHASKIRRDRDFDSIVACEQQLPAFLHDLGQLERFRRPRLSGCSRFS
jgi:hypothetical protein